MHRLFTCAHLLASVRVVRNAALAAIAYYIQTSRSRICVSGSLRVPLLSRKREREREEKEKKTASTADRAVGLRYPARSVFIIALSVPQRLIAVPYGENKCTERGGTRGGEERLRGCRPFHSTIILFARFYRRRERKGGTEARDKRRGWTRRNKGTQYIESESCSTIS